MIADIFKYFSARLALSYLLFMLGAAGIMYFEEGKTYPDYFLYALLFLSFIISSMILSHLGKWRFNALIVDAQECDITRYFKKGEVLFEKLLILTHSFHFLPGTAAHLRERAFKEYSRFLLALDIKSEKAFQVHKEAYKCGWENEELKSKLVSSLLGKRNWEKDDMASGVKLASSGKVPDEFIDSLTEKCLSKKIMDYDAQEVFQQALNNDSKHIPKILDKILPGILSLERDDPFAVELYFKAVEKKYRLSDKCRKILLKLAKPYLFDKDPGEMEQRLVNFYKAATTPRDQGKDASVFYSYADKKRHKTGKSRKRQRERSRTVSSKLKSLLPDSTFFYISFGILLLFFISYHSYRNKLTPPIKVDQELPQPDSASKAKHSAKIQKYVPFRSDAPFTIQVGAYNSIERAEQVMNKLKNHSKSVYWLPARIGDKTWYRVRVGEFADEESARTFAKELEKKKIVGRDYYLTNFKDGFALNKNYSEKNGTLGKKSY